MSEVLFSFCKILLLKLVSFFLEAFKVDALGKIQVYNWRSCLKNGEILLEDQMNSIEMWKI